ncbi:MAG: hypothetical protein ABI878_01580 [Acidobacteriota bacterium]
MRVEVNGLVKTWSIPKGPTMDPASQRRAIASPESLDFGSTHICDRGEFSCVLDFERSWEKGWLVFTLDGAKFKGQFMLERSARNYFNWSLFKLTDEYANAEIEVEEPDDSWATLPLFATAAMNRESAQLR